MQITGILISPPVEIGKFQYANPTTTTVAMFKKFGDLFKVMIG